MKIVIVSPKGKHQRFATDLFCEGLTKHNVSFETKTDAEPTECDLLIGWGLPSIERAEKFYRIAHKNFLLMEASYLEPRLDRNGFIASISLGYNGLNGNADFLNKGKDSHRWDTKFNDGRLKEWKKEGEYILLTGQVPGDRSLKNLDDDNLIKGFAPNYRYIIKKIREVTDLPIVFKPHPMSSWSDMGLPCRVSEEPLSALLEHALAVVTINSNSGVDSMVRGVPVLALDKGSMCWDICMKEFFELHNIHYPDRQQWLNELSWCQWFFEEISSGDAWEHLKTFYD